MASLLSFLNNKPIFYKRIDYSNIQKAYSIIRPYLDLPYVIHLVGTNGKGSTGRFLAHYLSNLGLDTIHYSSPHIQSFNERIWINGRDVRNKNLNQAHKTLQQILPQSLIRRLSYFEYTTLIALYLSSGRDYLVLEAGLGGEFDATNVVHNDLSLITPIGLDHQEFLGNSIDKIAKTKINSVDTTMIVARQIEQRVNRTAKKIVKKKNLNYLDAASNLSSTEKYHIQNFIQKNALAEFLSLNLELAMSAVRYLNLQWNLKYLKGIELKGRMQRIESEFLSASIYLDVGHNSLAAQAITHWSEEQQKE
jgi:dihydrofolate synthase/folylpolyglutamate synthase